MVPKREVAALEQRQVDDRMLVGQLPDQPGGEADDGDDRQHDDEGRIEPVGVLARVEHASAARRPRAPAAPARPCRSAACASASRGSRRLRQQSSAATQPDRHVDQEDPAPVSSCRRYSRPGSGRRSARPAWSSTRCRARCARFAGGKIEISSACEPGIIGPDTRALQHAEDDQRRQAPGDAAQEGGDGEQRAPRRRRCAPRRSGPSASRSAARRRRWPRRRR